MAIAHEHHLELAAVVQRITRVAGTTGLAQRVEAAG
jgi:hypothetical protein